MARYSVVIPCYKSAASIGQVISQTVDEFGRLGIDDYEFVLVNDCSPDGGETIAELRRLGSEHDYVTVVDLGKNAGQHNATMAGLNYATGDYIISMDDDLQTHPSQIVYLRDKMDEGYDIVYGYYEKKEESLFRRMGSALNHWTVRALIHKPAWLKTSSFWMIRRYVRDYAIQYRHPNVHLQGVFLRTTDNIACVPVKHFARQYGTSGYDLKKLVKLYLNIVGFSITPLQVISNLGFLLAGIGFVLDLYLVIRKLLNQNFAAGWFSLAGALCFFSGVILIGLGVVGTYVGRLLMGQTNSPQFVVREVLGARAVPGACPLPGPDAGATTPPAEPRPAGDRPAAPGQAASVQKNARGRHDG